jgi:hypothetical protein
MEPRRWLVALGIFRPRPLTLVIAGALLLRVIAWKVLEGPVIKGDGAAYIEWAQRLAAGDLSGFRDYPLHQLYPLLIAPAFGFGIPLAPYLFVLHLALSVATVYLLYYACRQFASPRVAVAAAVIAAIYPSLLLWSAYVLSETPFFFFLALFVASLAHVLARPAGRRPSALALLSVSGLLLLFARPVSVAVLGTAAIAVAYALLSDVLGARRARVVTLAGVLVVLVTTIALFAAVAPLRQTVLRYPTVAQSLWLSTRYSSSSIAEWLPVAQQSQALLDRFGGDLNAFYDYKVHEALDFIRSQPGTYAYLVGRRFTSYWLPGLFSDGWSTSHRLFDLLLALWLYAGMIVSLYSRRDIVRWTLFGVALALGILTSFSQIDTDGRYRVPAELVILSLAADGWARLIVAGWKRRVGQAQDQLPAPAADRVR